MKLKLLMATLLILSSLGTVTIGGKAFAAESVIGVWKLVSYTARDEESGAETKPLGEKPEGLLIYTSDGYMSAVGVAEGRTMPMGTGEKQTQERAKLFTSMIAYSGRYTVESDKVIHHVEVAWNPSLVGTDQVRYVSFEGDNIHIRTPPIISVADGRKQIYTVFLRRVK